jgi:uncharacterized membrane protein
MCFLKQTGPLCDSHDLEDGAIQTPVLDANYVEEGVQKLQIDFVLLLLVELLFIPLADEVFYLADAVHVAIILD